MFNISRRKAPTPLEQLVLDYVWAHPDCTAETVREGLATQRKLKDSTIRTILRKLEEKGYVNHNVDGRTFIYRPADSRRNVAVQAVQQVVERFCDGSLEELLVGLVDNRLIDRKQLQRLEAQIASHREKKI
jgi:BlaI family penicillinase repressor